LGYLANGGTGPVTSESIAKGMDKIFDELLKGGKSFYSAISNATGTTLNSMADVEALFDNPSQSLVSFIRELSVASKGGAGSIIASSLSDGGNAFLGSGAVADPAFSIKNWSVGAAGKISLSAGGYDQIIQVDLFRLDTMGQGLSDVNILTLSDANSSVEHVETAINKVSQMRSHYGAIQNRLEHTFANLSNTVENLTASESRIRDADMAYEITEHVRNQILHQSGQAMLAQANQVPQNILSLLGA
jgi:flagellin-like hook-associated protein FlgL